MSDGTTGFQVAPTEDAMKLSQMFSKAAEAIVNASTYPAQLASLNDQVLDLQHRLEAANLHANELDTTLHELRQQRDEAKFDAAHYRKEGENLSINLQEVNNINNNLKARLDNLALDCETLRKERDEYGMQVLHLEEQVTAWKARAEEGRKKLNDMLSLFKPDDDYKSIEPQPEPPVDLPPFISKPTPMPEPVPEPTELATAGAQPIPEPLPPPTEPPQEPDWSRNVHYSTRWGRYVNEEWKD